ncbi:MAG: class I adenylate-forming enzyme family protein, partial [Magnetovibrio sp.]|nr:class I adenylate-forming enzyme family protein [Magnetovibrio sp.]
MRPTLLSAEAVDAYLEAGHWKRVTLAERYREYALASPDAIAFRDPIHTLTWAELDALSDRVAANLIGLGLSRDGRALVQMPSGCREVTLRIAFKKAGIIGVFAPMQWRRKELTYVIERVGPELAVLAPGAEESGDLSWFDAAFCDMAEFSHRLDLGDAPADGWLSWDDLTAEAPPKGAVERIGARQFAFDEVSLITASSGTSGLAKLCEWPEAAQLCIGRLIGERMNMTAADNVGIFAPMSGAAGVLVWLVSGSLPCAFTFPADYKAAALLNLAEDTGITVATTVPVILARLAQEPLGGRDLSALRALRVGTAAADVEAGRKFEAQTGCRVVIAAGSMECPGFAHAEFGEPRETRLNGSIGLPFPGARLRIADDEGRDLPAGDIGELRITAPFAASGYWNDPETTAAAWSEGWYATGDFGYVDAAGRLRLMGRLKETINRSGLKILPAEVEREIGRHPDVFECAVVKAPDPEYGEVPWAFVHLRPGRPFAGEALAELLKA